MNNFLFLIKGDLIRAKKYKIFAASMFMPVFWIAILELFKVYDYTNWISLIVFVDVTIMSIIFVGAGIMFEKEEKTLMTMMVTPISKTAYFVSKIMTNLVMNISTVLVIFLYASLVREINVNLAVLVLAMIVISVFHSVLGFWFAMGTRDFTGFLTKIMSLFLVLALPLLFEVIGFINNNIISNLMYLLPTKASYTLLSIEKFEIAVLFSFIYMILLAGYSFYISVKKFDYFIMKESGV